MFVALVASLGSVPIYSLFSLYSGLSNKSQVERLRGFGLYSIGQGERENPFFYYPKKSLFIPIPSAAQDTVQYEPTTRGQRLVIVHVSWNGKKLVNLSQLMDYKWTHRSASHKVPVLRWSKALSMVIDQNMFPKSFPSPKDYTKMGHSLFSEWYRQTPVGPCAVSWVFLGALVTGVYDTPCSKWFNLQLDSIECQCFVLPASKPKHDTYRPQRPCDLYT